MKHRLIAPCLVALCLLSLASPQQQGKDIVKATFKVTATFKNFQVGDYLHATIIDTKNKARSFFLKGDGLEYFLAVNVNKKGTFKVQRVDSYFPEAGGRMETERIISARFGKTSYEGWWKAQRKKYSLAQLAKKYDPLVEKLTK